MDLLTGVAAEHVAALAPVGALASLRRGCPQDARAHLAVELGRRPTIAERRELVRAIRDAARTKATALIEEAAGYEDPQYAGIDVDALERALFEDDQAEAVPECSSCDDLGYSITRDDEGIPEHEACDCTAPRQEAA